MMESLFFIICSGFFGFLYQKLERVEAKIDHVEEDLIVLKMTVLKCKSDHSDFTLE